MKFTYLLSFIHTACFYTVVQHTITVVLRFFWDRHYGSNKIRQKKSNFEIFVFLLKTLWEKTSSHLQTNYFFYYLQAWIWNLLLLDVMRSQSLLLCTVSNKDLLQSYWQAVYSRYYSMFVILSNAAGWNTIFNLKSALEFSFYDKEVPIGGL